MGCVARRIVDGYGMKRGAAATRELRVRYRFRCPISTPTATAHLISGSNCTVTLTTTTTSSSNELADRDYGFDNRAPLWKRVPTSFSILRHLPVMHTSSQRGLSLHELVPGVSSVGRSSFGTSFAGRALRRTVFPGRSDPYLPSLTCAVPHARSRSHRP